MTLTSNEQRAAAPVADPAAWPAAWPDVAARPHRPVHAAVARRLFHRAVARLPVRAELPDGRIVGGGGPDAPLLRVRRDAFFHRLGADGLIGFGEAFMSGDWDADDPADVLTPFAGYLTSLVPDWMQRLRQWYVVHQPAAEDNSPAGARRNIARHYDLSNAFFELFLDESMTYSAGLFGPGDDPRGSLYRAQLRKIDRILDVAAVGSGTRLLEIGTGWGALAIRAAQRGAVVTSVTLSREQQALAQQRIAAAGVADRVTVELRDYREVQGSYDAVVSVEMIEAVGDRYWPAYFSVIDRVLAPGGRVGLQAIVIEHDRLLATRGQYTWIHKYVFPGGLLPSVRALSDVLAGHTTLRIAAEHRFGGGYAATLRQWQERLDARADEVAALGFDPTFHRMWRFYLAYCEAGFRAGYLDVAQLLLTR